MTSNTAPAARIRRTLTCIAVSSLLVLHAVPMARASTPTFTFDGGGWGHGIGMSQYGARGYALQGKTHAWILAHYYQGTRIETAGPVTVRVNLDKSAAARSQWQIQSGSSTSLSVIQVSDSTKRANLDVSGRYWITTAAGNTRVHKDDPYEVPNPDGTSTVKHRPGELIRTFSGACYAASGGLVRILDASGPYGRASARWRGTIRFLPATATTSKAVNFVTIEQYLYGVVPCEVSSSWPAESLKAQAVAARSYAYQDAKDARIIYCTTSSQVYGGYDTESAETRAAVDGTVGQLVWYGSETTPVKTFFFSSSGGHTANVEDVWTSSTPRPYYKGVDDADQASPHYRWTAGPWTTDVVSAKVRDRDNGTANTDPLDYSAPSPYVITKITAERTQWGHAHHVTLTWSNGRSFRISGDTLRSALGLRSTKFAVSSGLITPEVTAFEESDSRFAWHGSWVGASGAALSGGSMRYSALGGSKFTAVFDGTGIAWIGNRAATYGKATVSIDGSVLGTYDLYATSSAYKQRIFSKQGLAQGTHTLVIKVDGTRNPLSKSSTVAVDRIDVTNGSLRQADPGVSGYEDPSPLVAWLGNWTPIAETAASGGTHIYSSSANSKVQLRFVGSAVTWIGARSPVYGTARVTLDGIAEYAVLTTATEALSQQPLWSRSGLDMSRVHSLSIEVLGPGSGGTEGAASVDRLDVTGGWALAPLLPAVRVEDSSPKVVYEGAWVTNRNASLSGGTHHAAGTAGATATLAFQGTGFTLVSTKAPSYGLAEVWLDGARIATLDLYSVSRVYQSKVFSKQGLACRPHTVQVKVLGKKRAASTGPWVAVDALVVNGQTVDP